jgi:hypothetical protein
MEKGRKIYIKNPPRERESKGGSKIDEKLFMATSHQFLHQQTANSNIIPHFHFDDEFNKGKTTHLNRNLI